MSEPEVAMPTQDDAEDCLHCAIMELIDERAAAGETDIGIITERLAESLVDLILRVPTGDQAQLLAHTLTALGDLYLQKREGGSGGSHPISLAWAEPRRLRSCTSCTKSRKRAASAQAS